MKVYPIRNSEGLLHALEIDVTIFGRRKVLKVVKTLEGVNIIREPKIFLSWFREESFCEFSINNVLFEVQEPFGDNSRYLISSKHQPGERKELQLVAEVFARA